MGIFVPFWSVVSSIWCKLQLDHWLEMSIGRLNQQFRSTLWNHNFTDDTQDEAEMERTVQLYIESLGKFVVEYQWHFNQLWTNECGLLMKFTSRSLWLSAFLAVSLTALMFGLWLANRADRC